MSFQTGILHGIAISLDYGVEMLFRWRKADPMTVSSLCGLALRRGEKWTVLAVLGKILNFISTGHCESAIEADKERLKTALLELNG
jgi:hypothetical protein